MSIPSTTKMNVSKGAKGQLAIPKNWENRQITFTGDEVIDAYYQGRDDERSSIERALKNQLNTNIKTAAQYAVRLFTKSKESQIDLKGIYLKIDNIDQFTALFVADKKAFIGDEFLQVYSIAEDIKKELRENIYLKFSFLPDTGTINDTLLLSDGYYLKYKDGK